MPDAYLFDLDGTLIDSAADIAASVNHVLTELGHDPLPEARVISFVGDGVENLLDRALRAVATADNAPSPEDRLRTALPRFQAHYAEHAMDRTDFFPGVPDVLDALEDHALAVISNKPEAFSRHILRALDAERRFRVVIGGDTFSERKPSPLPLVRCLDELNVDAARALMVGDGPQDLAAGRAAGVATCAVTWGLNDRARLERENPTHVISTPRELLTITA